MWSYTYKHGDRPLEGYTIQRAAGRGGFGEVYYAVSDAGREVALKAITGFEQIELRGIGHCMNLKSPHLVSIFDVRQNEQGRWFVLMEYVNGPNLRELLDASPAGLGTQKAAFFLREIAKGLSYLHDCGIVHRDLKPANIFFENGYVKIGDYGLSKAIEPTHHSGQTVTVGTVHYMAPEVGCGKYDRSIDIYAMGALLFEMLTGIVPFVGASAGEILIKHISHEADCTGIPEPFCSAVKKAMAKDPTQRFQTVQEMVEAVFGAEHVRNSVSQFSPQDLSMVAGRVAGRIAPHPPAMPLAGRSPGNGSGPNPAMGGSSVTSPNGLGTPGPSWAAAAGQVAGRGLNVAGAAGGGGRGARISSTILGPFADATPAVDPFSLRHRLLLGVIAMAVVGTFAQVFDDSRDEVHAWFFTLLGIAGASLGIAVTARGWLPRPRVGNQWADRFALGGAGALGAVLFTAPVWLASNEISRWLGSLFIGLTASLAVANLRKLTYNDRRERLSFKAAAKAGLLAFVAAAIFGNDGNPALAIAIAGGAALVVQVLTPWDEAAAARRAEAEGLAGAGGGGDDDDEAGDAAPAPFAPRPAASGTAATPGMPMPAGHPAAPPAPPAPPAALRPAATTTFGVFPTPSPARAVPRAMAIAWFCTALVFGMLGLSFFIAAIVMGDRDREFSETLAAALSFLTIGGYAFLRMWKRTLTSWWSYLVIPTVRLGCVVVVVAVWANLAFDRQIARRQSGDYVTAIAIFSCLWLLLWVVPVLWRAAIPPAAPAGGSPTPSPRPPQGVNGGTAPPAPPPDRPVPPAPGVVAAAGAMADQVGDAVGSALTSTWGAVRDAVHAPAGRRARAASPQRPRRQRPDFIGGAVGLVAALLLAAALLVALLLAFDLPAFIAAGLPNAGLRDDFMREFFAGVNDWPSLMRGVMFAVGLLLFIAGLAGLVFARRRSGGLHLLRGVVGSFGMFGAVTPFEKEFAGCDLWPTVAGLVNAGLTGAAMQAVFERLREPGTFVALVLFAASVVLLAWPRRRAGGAGERFSPVPSSSTSQPQPRQEGALS